MKIQMFLSAALSTWDADFYIKADDDVHVNIGMPTQGLLSFWPSLLNVSSVLWPIFDITH
jgi:hypothetical protein